jgi:tetratricopeptide (TPR) repeat protein
VIALIQFTASTLRADLFYKKALVKIKPSFHLDKPHYYQGVISLINHASKLRSDNASYYAKYADYLFEALSDGLEKNLLIEREKIEELYIKAITLNPLYFEYHLKLGWFYNQFGDKAKAKEELIKATELYPSYYKVHLFLSKYYFQAGNADLGFKALLLSSYYTQGSGYRYEIIKEMREDIKGIPQVNFDGNANLISYTILSNSHTFDFKKEGFPHLLLPSENNVFPIWFPLKIRVYLKDKPSGIILYNNYISQQSSASVETGEYNMYELGIGSFSSSTYLDELKIKTNPPTIIEKIEFILQL